MVVMHDWFYQSRLQIGFDFLFKTKISLSLSLSHFWCYFSVDLVPIQFDSIDPKSNSISSMSFVTYYRRFCEVLNFSFNSHFKILIFKISETFEKYRKKVRKSDPFSSHQFMVDRFDWLIADTQRIELFAVNYSIRLKSVKFVKNKSEIEIESSWIEKRAEHFGKQYILSNMTMILSQNCAPNEYRR